MNKRTMRFLSFLLLLLQSYILNSQNGLTINELNSGADKIDLISYLQIKKTESDSFIPLQKVLNKLPVNKSLEFSLAIFNSTNDTIVRILQFPHRYVTANSFNIMSSTTNRMENYFERLNCINLSLAPQEEKLITVSIDELNRAEENKLDLILVSKQYLEKSTNRVYYTQAFFLGLFAFLFLFNLVIFFVTRWRVYFKYAVYIFSALIYFLYYFGLLQTLFTSVNQIPINLTYTWYSIIFISYFYFLNQFGEYKKFVPRAYQLLNVGIIFKSSELVINTVLHVLGLDFIYSHVYIDTILSLEIILMLFILFYIVKNKNLRGKIVIIASCFLIVGGIIEQAKLFPGWDNAYFVECGITAELLIFSVGLGYTTKLYYDEKRKAELLYIEQLVANQSFQKESNEKLEQIVKQRTEELNHEKSLVDKKNTENELLLAEIHHRVKNNLQVVSSLLSLQEKSMKSEDAKMEIRRGKERIRSMELVHKMLYSANSFSGIEMKDYVKKLSEGLIESFGIHSNEIQLEIDFPKIILDVDTAIPVGLILNELIINALKHAKKEAVKLELKIQLLVKDKTWLQLNVSDNGHGGISEVQSSNSFGLRIIQALIRQLNGELTIEENDGIHYSITLQWLNENKSAYS
ncbi:sensor histidine kinase [Aurantibacillus circumpalustris]|uniref:sensor histidine kinase n=1 Tax=Aurantibacillus circumpalustris TaxID=3036359 RepID=UPI00295BCD52|nr:histidine kinase dimerization/phosphoacceptor domain -containing protein [Aurantibacillus circumpalustris]